ncbi:MAG: hypothetical protein J6C96_11060 [Oscillospiraceae bacterium]|nr:hypothetical protein [Oscillospiraceae bacterium]
MSFYASTKNRSWVATIHITNMINAGLTKEEYENPEYLAEFFINEWERSGKGRKAGIAVCVSENGCYHAHIACYGNTTTLKKVSEILYSSHVEPQLGGKEQLKSYLLKEGIYSEKGEQVLYSKGLDIIADNQGKRNDLDEIEEMLDNGATPEDIFNQSFRYRKYEKMIRAEYIARKINETPLIKTMNNEYHWGCSGTGKTYTYIKLCEKHSKNEVYLCNDYANTSGSAGGFDFYINNPAKIIVLDEFRGNISYSQLLSMLDVYSRNQQHCRYQNIYNLWESVIICSIYPPETVYKFMVDNKQQSIDTLQQFIRRLNTIVYHFKSQDGKYKTFSMSSNDYVNAETMKIKAYEYEKKYMDKEDLIYDKNMEVACTLKAFGINKQE